MGKLPTGLSGRQVPTALERAGFVFRRQRGSHMILRRDEPYARAGSCPTTNRYVRARFARFFTRRV